MKASKSFVVSSIVALVVLMMMALSLGLNAAAAQAPESQAGSSPEGPTVVVPGAIPVQGRLTDAGGSPLNGTYNLTFRLYDVDAGGTALCSDTNSVVVENGLFNSYLDNCYNDVWGQKLWFSVQVSGDPEMTPRQVIYPVPYALSLVPKAEISGTVASNDALLDLDNYGSPGKGLRAEAQAATGETYGVVGAAKSPDGYGGLFYNNGGGTGLWGQSSDPSGGDGVKGESYSVTGRGLYAQNHASGIAIAGYGDAPSTTLHLYPTLYLVQADGSGDFVVGASTYWGTRSWRVDRTGRGYFNGGTQNTGADFAEQLPVRGNEKDYEPGDVLVISAETDRAVELSTQPFATAVIGVYSTQPAVLAGAPDQNDPLAGIPVAITGIVPCKVSAENGAIHRGDLLVTSSTPGYAMHAGVNPPQGTVLGKAMGELKDGTGVIQVLVTLQ